MKPILRIALSLSALLGLSGCPGEDAKPEGPLPLKVAMDPRIGEPFVSEPSKGQFGGFEVDISRYLAAKLGRPLEIVSVRWNQLPETVLKKKADLALNAIEKPAKDTLSAELTHTDRYYTAYQQLAVAKKDKYSYSLSDLKGKKIGVVEGSVAQLLLAELNQLKQSKIAITPFATPDAAFSALANGQIQATLTERAFAGWHSWKKGSLRLTGDPITGEIPYVALMRTDNAELKKSVNQILVAARKDPAFKQIFEKWHVSIRR